MLFLLKSMVKQISGVPAPQMIYGSKSLNLNKGVSGKNCNSFAPEKNLEQCSTSGADRNTFTEITGLTPVPRSRILYHCKRPGPPCRSCRNYTSKQNYISLCRCKEGFVGLPSNHDIRRRVSVI